MSLIITTVHCAGVVERPKMMPKDNIPWTTLLYAVGPGYDWGSRVDNNYVDTSKCKSQIKIQQ